MTAVHRPLSAWIAYVLDGSGTIGPVNDGEDRLDARTMPEFAHGWRRVGLERTADSRVLGLRHPDTGAVVVELDDYGRPISVSARGVSVIEDMERRWAASDADLVPAIATLTGESLTVRYWLVLRLAAEADPPDEVFGILPWELLDRLVAAIGRAFEPDGRPGDLVEVRHWLTPAVIGLSGPLEQLDHGLRTGDDTLVREGATAFLSNARDLPVWRIPTGSRAALAVLARRLGGTYPEHRALATEVVAHLTVGPPRATDADIVAFFEAVLVGVSHLGPHDPDRPEGATLSFPDAAAVVIGADARGTVTRTVDGLFVTIARFREDVPPLAVAVYDGRPPVPLTRRGRLLSATIGWTGPGLPERLVFHLAGGPGDAR